MPPENAEALRLCDNQKVRSGQTKSFSVLGLVLIFIFGGCVIIFGPFVPWLIARVRATTGLGSDKQDAWDQEWFLETQRRLYEELELGDWRPGNAMVPTTAYGQRFSPLHDVPTRNQMQLVGFKSPGVDKSGLESWVFVKGSRSQREVQIHGIFQAPVT